MVYHAGLGREVNLDLQPVPEDPDGQVAATIGIMSRYVREDSHSPQILSDLESLKACADDSPQTSGELAWVEAVYWHVKQRVRFVQDEETAAQIQPWYEGPIVESLIRPVDMAAYCGEGDCLGDCDDFSMYLAALLMGLGIECSFVTVAADPRDPSQYSHVYVAAYLKDGTRVPLDASHGDQPGWEAEQWYRKCEWPIHGRYRIWQWVLGLGMVLWIWAQGKGMWKGGPRIEVKEG